MYALPHYWPVYKFLCLLLTMECLQQLANGDGLFAITHQVMIWLTLSADRTNHIYL